MSHTDAIILHQYDMSPFSEKIRKIFAYKNAPWHAVTQSMWLPRPHLTPMTGAYRRIPVLQIGADLYCDTRLIARKIDQLFPESPLYPKGLEAAADCITQWPTATCSPPPCRRSSRRSGHAASATHGRPQEDAARSRPGRAARDGPRPQDELRVFAAGLDRTLTQGGFLLGKTFSVADAAVYHVLWFVRNAPDAGAILARFPACSGGSGHRRDGSGQARGDDAGNSARHRHGHRARDKMPGRRKRSQRPRPGTTVTISSDDLPQDRVEGEVLALDVDEIVILRQSPECGAIALHFPRAGYRIAE